MSDLIRRQDAVDAINSMMYRTFKYEIDRVDVLNRINSIPSADRPTGEWKKIDTWKYCSECGWTIYTEDDRAYNYCPNCGAKMRGEEE